MLRGVSARLLARCSNAATPAAPLASLSPLEWPARAVACSATAATTTTTNSWCFPQQQQQQAAAVRGTAWLAPASVRHYFVIPKPSWGYDEVMQLKEGRKGRNRDGLKLGRPLNMAERKEFNRAKIYGFLRMNNLCKQPVCNKYLSYCWHRQRPYVAINKHGDVMVVDLRPVNGFGALESADRFDSVSNAVSMLIEDHWMTGLQIVNDMQPESLVEERENAIKRGTDGSNEGKQDDADISDSFQVLTKKRQQSLKLATDIWAEYVKLVPGNKTPRETFEAYKKRAEWRQEKWERTARRKIRALLANKKIRNLPRNSLDGFKYWDAQGQAHLEIYPAKWINKPC